LPKPSLDNPKEKVIKVKDQPPPPHHQNLKLIASGAENTCTINLSNKIYCFGSKT